MNSSFQRFCESEGAPTSQDLDRVLANLLRVKILPTPTLFCQMYQQPDRFKASTQAAGNEATATVHR